MRRILNKKGDLTNNTLMIIIAAIGIGLLAFGVGKLWGLYSNNEEKNAQTVLDAVIAKVDALGKGESNKFVFQGFDGGENWHLIGFTKGQVGWPDKCFPDSCLCVCYGTAEDFHYSDADFRKEACDEVGFCERLDYDEIESRAYDLESTILKGSVFELEISKGPVEEPMGYSVKKNSIMVRGYEVGFVEYDDGGIGYDDISP